MVDGPGFGERLAAAVSSRGPLCVGVDPHPELLRQWGWDAGVEGLARFCDVCVEAFGDFALVKPQVAFFEAYGSAGFAVLERTMAALRERGALVLADAKRGDIGSTMAAYAQAWAGNGPLAADAVTASPYLGFGALRPLIDLAAANRRGVFVLAATSNPEGGSVQRAVLGGRTVAQAIVDEAAAVNRADDRPGAVGVVVGATLARAEVPDLSGLGGPVLVPGVGVQGGNPEGLAGFGGARRGQLLPAAAREILRCGPDVGALRAAADRLRDAVGYLA